MKFKYTGDEASVTLRGVAFPKGKTVKVDDASLAAKIDALPHFQKVKGRTNAKNG
jgi:hypothetical protein